MGLFLIILSNVGYWLLLRYLKFSKYLAFITIFWIQILILYIFSMLNLLIIGIYVTLASGVIAFLCSLIFYYYKKSTFFVKENPFHFFDFWMIAVGLGMILVLNHSYLIHYDNFSHWATMVKFLHFEGRLPSSKDTIISFTSYPPAMALFINYYIYWLKFNDSTMLIVQFLYIWAGVYSIFGILRDKSRLLLSGILCFSIALSTIFNIEIRFNNLLVDYVIASVTLAGVVGIYVYQKNAHLQLSHVILTGINLLLIKNSGTFFVGVLLVYYLYVLLKKNNLNDCNSMRIRLCNATFYFLSASIVIFLPFFWWTWHVKEVFKVSKHALSATAFVSQLHTENSHYFVMILKKMLAHSLTIGSLSTQGLLLVNLVLISAAIVLKFLMHRSNQLLRHAILLDALFILYFISVYVMYIVSMPYKEAIQLAGFERYFSTIVILMIFIGTMVLVREFDNQLFEQRIERRSVRTYASFLTKKIYYYSSLLLIFFSIIGMSSEIAGVKYNNQINQNVLPRKLSDISVQSDHTSKKKFLLVDSNKSEVDSYYAGFVAKYYFFSPNAVAVEAFDMSDSDFKNFIEKFQYIVLPNNHPTFSIFVKKVFHQKIEKGVYHVTAHKLVPVN